MKIEKWNLCQLPIEIYDKRKSTLADVDSSNRILLHEHASFIGSVTKSETQIWD